MNLKLDGKEIRLHARNVVFINDALFRSVIVNSAMREMRIHRFGISIDIVSIHFAILSHQVDAADYSVGNQLQTA